VASTPSVPCRISTWPESYDGGRYRFDGPIVLDRGGAFGYTVRVSPRNHLLTSVAELGVVAVA
jgi:glycogen phosphorylase